MTIPTSMKFCIEIWTLPYDDFYSSLSVEKTRLALKMLLCCLFARTSTNEAPYNERIWDITSVTPFTSWRYLSSFGYKYRGFWTSFHSHRIIHHNKKKSSNQDATFYNRLRFNECNCFCNEARRLLPSIQSHAVPQRSNERIRHEAKSALLWPNAKGHA